MFSTSVKEEKTPLDNVLDELEIKDFPTESVDGFLLRGERIEVTTNDGDNDENIEGEDDEIRTNVYTEINEKRKIGTNLKKKLFNVT
ncbi:hypothetical protein JTB14_013657 [Gonioctena quinquepunctata]|nr:hypothetical protein JTB14_013657 [Gonioctena quinquepunctata]